MGNWDNSCYQNSVVQGLASLRPVESFLTQELSKYGRALQDSTNRTLFDTIQQLNDAEQNGKVIWMPKKLKSMSTWQQQDAQEYLSKILDEVDKELVHAAKGTSNLPGLAEEKGTAQSGSSAQNASSNPLEGFLAQRVACMQCGYSEGLSMIPFNCLTVPLGRDYRYDLSDCLEEYTKLEPIEGVDCAKCTLLKNQEQLLQLLHNSTDKSDLQKSVHRRLDVVHEVLESDDYSDRALTTTCQIPKKAWQSTTKSRQAVIARAPKSLVIHVNRSVFNEMTGAQTKNYAEVSFPATLDLSPWCLGKPPHGLKQTEDWSMNPAESMLPDDFSARRARPALYSLRAVVTHFGRHENGHYICYRKVPAIPGDDSKKTQERWWRLSDEDVSSVSEEEVLNQGGVFMLFYEQSESSPLMTEDDWSLAASQVLLPDDVDQAVEIRLVGDTRDNAPISVEAEARVPADRPEEDPTPEQTAQAAAIEASRSSLMAELRTVLPSVEPEHELTALGEGNEPSAVGYDSAVDTSAEATDDEHDSSPVVSQAPAASVVMRTAGQGQVSRGNDALDSPLRMASAF